MIRKIFMAFTVLAVFISPAHAQENSWEVYFSQSTINNIEISGDTVLCSTDGGVLLFDLSDSTFYSYYGGFDLRSGFVEGAAFDSEGNLWAGFRAHGVARIEEPFTDPDATWYSEEYGMISDSITCITGVGDDIYYGSSEGIGKFFQGLPSREAIISDFLEGNRIHDIFAESDTVIWVASDRGVTRFNRATLFYDHYDIDGPVSICSLDGALYVATDSTVHRFDDGEWPMVGGAGWPHQYPIRAISGGSGTLCATTWERAYVWNGSSWLSLDAGIMKDLFFADYGTWSGVSINDIAIDGSGNPWIGGIVRDRYRGVDLCFHDGTSWRNKRPDQLSQNDIREVSTDPSGGIWFSTRLYGVCYFSGEDWLCYTQRRGSGNDDALSLNYDNIAMYCDSRGRLWTSALDYPVDMIELNGRSTMDDDEWEHFSRDEDGISSRHVEIREDPAGNIWFLSDGLNLANGEWGIDIVDETGAQWTSINPGNSDMSSGNVVDCAFGPDRIYIALDGYGIDVWIPGGYGWSDLDTKNDDIWYTLLSGSDLPSLEFDALLLDGEDLWIATSGGLVKRGGDGTVTEYSANVIGEERKILNSTVHDIALDRHGKLWVGTEGGINIIDEEGVVSGNYTTFDYWEQYLQFIYPDASSVISYLPSAFCSTLVYDSQTDILWIGTDNGVAALDVNISVGPDLPLSELILYPNPLYASSYDSGLKISGITEIVDVEVYNTEGELVHRKADISEGEEVWDLLTINGFKAVSGVYIVRITGSAGSEIRKVAVIR